MVRNDCPEAEKIMNAELSHDVEYNSEYYDLPESVQDKLSQKEMEENYYVDLEGEKKWQEEHHIKLGQHLKTCTIEGCKTTLQVWKDDEDLKKYVESKQE